jgi:hypothetical protein
MKVSLTLEERRYLGALIKVMAAHTAAQPGALDFWRSVYEQLHPSRQVADFRRKEVDTLLAVCDKGIKTIAESATLKQDESASVRASILEEHLTRVKAKIEARLKEVSDNVE